MIWLLLGLLLLAILLLPGIWVQHVLKRHSGHRKDFAGTGGDMARHLLSKMGLDSVLVEGTEAGDHYDPASRTVRLTKDKLDGKSLTAVVVAAHEVGHALLLAPLLAGVSPGFSRLALVVAVGAMLLGTLVHLITLPVEWDASFGKALPLLRDGEYLQPKDMRAARSILLAAAMTYVAASLMSLLNIGRWLRYLRR